MSLLNLLIIIGVIGVLVFLFLWKKVAGSMNIIFLPDGEVKAKLDMFEDLDELARKKWVIMRISVRRE